MIFIGIDPGTSGALVILKDRDIMIRQIFSEENYLESLRYIHNLMLQGESCVCCLEHVHSMPRDSHKSAFAFGNNFGFIQGLLKAFDIPFELVTPQKWKKEFSVTSDKNTSIAVAKRLFPKVDLRRTEGSKRCTKDHDGIAEALLMAEYARRNL